MAKTGVINARVEQHVRERLDRYCQAREIKLATVVEKALVAWLDENESTQNVEHNTTQCTHNDERDRAEIDELKNILIQQQQQLDQQQQRLDELEHEPQRLERLENQMYETQCRVNSVEDSYSGLTNTQNTHNEHIRQLQHDVQKLKISRPTRDELNRFDESLATKIEQQQMDERLAMATEPLWDAIAENKDSYTFPVNKSEPSQKDDDFGDRAANDDDFTSDQTTSDSPSKDVLEQFANGLKGNELANRLNVKENSVSTAKSKGDEHFKQWSAKRDPDSIAWQFVKTDKRGKYYPIGN